MHVRCPHCRNAIEIVGQEELSDVTCPSCGSQFNLITETQPYHQATQSVGHFQLLETLGSGSFGTVWKARDTKLDRLVAIKIPRSGQIDSASVAMFLREARATAQLKHPGIVAVHEVGREDGALYIVSDFVQGITLADRLTAGPLAAREAAGLLEHVADALHHAHEAGVIHRDLKPQNIMLDQRGQPQLMDFGLAKREAGEITMTVDGRVLGTAAYMSPEQARGEGHRVDRRTDVYSLGVILFELLTGERPFRGNSHMLLHQVIHDEPPSPRKLNSRVPRDLETISLKCLARDPHRRYATAQAVADELRRYLRGEPIHARPLGRVQRGWRWVRRNPLVAGLSTAIAITLLAGALVSSFFAVGAHHAASQAIAQKHRANAEAAKVTENFELAKTYFAKANENAALANRNADLAYAHSEEVKRQNQLARRHLYFAHLNLAQSAAETGRVGQTVRLLERYRAGPAPAGPDDFRGFEWFYWDLWSHSDLVTLQGHTAPVRSVAFSPDGRRLASASYDTTVKVWDAISGEALHTLKGSEASVFAVAFSPDGRRLASAHEDRTIKIWDATAGNELLTLVGHTAEVNSVAFSPDGQRLASASHDATVRVWDAQTGLESLTLRGHAGVVFSVAFSPDGERLASASQDRTVKLWDVATGQESLTIKGHPGWVMSVTFSPDGQRLASASHETVKVWSAATGQELLTLPDHAARVASVTFSPDGRRLAAAQTDGTIKLSDAATGQALVTLRGHADQVQSVAFSPDGRRLASASYDHSVRLWDTATSQESLTLNGHDSPLTSVAFSPDGRHLASASQDRAIKLWDSTTGQESLTLKGHAHPITCVAFSPDGQRLASASEDHTVKIWDPATGQASLTLEGHTEIVNSVAFSPDGRRLASASNDQTIRLWDAATGQQSLVLKGHTGWVMGVAFSADGQRLASASHDKTVKLWDAATGQTLRTLEGHAAEVNSVTFSPDGQRLASTGWDHLVKVWDATTGKAVLTLEGHTAAVCSATFSPNGQRLASASHDLTIKVWDTVTGQESLTLHGHSGWVMSVAFSPDGQRLASASEDDSIKIWDGRPLTEELRSERDALSILRFLCATSLSKERLLQTIKEDEAIREPVRSHTLELAPSYWENDRRDGARRFIKSIRQTVDSSFAVARKLPADASALNATAWIIAAQPKRTRDEYDGALRLAERAVRIAPGSWLYVNTLGVLQYRLGDFARARETLTRSRELSVKLTGQPHPASIAFLSMAEHQLANEPEAKQLVELLRTLLEQPQWINDAQARQFLREADSVMAGER